MWLYQAQGRCHCTTLPGHRQAFSWAAMLLSSHSWLLQPVTAGCCSQSQLVVAASHMTCKADPHPKAAPAEGHSRPWAPVCCRASPSRSSSLGGGLLQTCAVLQTLSASRATPVMPLQQPQTLGCAAIRCLHISALLTNISALLRTQSANCQHHKSLHFPCHKSVPTAGPAGTTLCCANDCCFAA